MVTWKCFPRTFAEILLDNSFSYNNLQCSFHGHISLIMPFGNVDIPFSPLSPKQTTVHLCLEKDISI